MQLFTQEFMDWEAMIGVDGRDDETHRVLLRYQENDARLRCFFFSDGPHNDWGHELRDRLLKMSSGNYVCFLNDDVRISPLYLKRLREAVEGFDASVCRIEHEVHGIIPHGWHGAPRGADIDCMNAMVSGDLARATGWKHRHYMADFAFFAMVHNAGARWNYVDEVLGWR